MAGSIHDRDLKGLYLGRMYLQGVQQKDRQAGRQGPSNPAHRYIHRNLSKPLHTALPHSGELEDSPPPTANFLDTRYDSPEHLRETIRPEGQLALQNKGVPKKLGSATQRPCTPRVWGVVRGFSIASFCFLEIVYHVTQARPKLTLQPRMTVY